MPLLGATALHSPAKAATVTCQAINATGLLSGPPPTIPGPACSGTVQPGDSFEIDFSNVFSSDPSDFSLANTYSLQIANLNTGPSSSSLSFTNVEFLITGKFQPTVGPEVVFTTPTAIRVWQASGQTGQGITSYTTNGSGVDFGLGEAFTSANFTLTSPQPFSPLGIAGLINTIPVNLNAAGVTQFTSAKIRGNLASASDLNSTDFSAGLGIFTSNIPTTQPPNIIYGNAFNTPVPGPLPIVGAGAAFSWSRRLRRRVQKSSATGSAA